MCDFPKKCYDRSEHVLHNNEASTSRKNGRKKKRIPQVLAIAGSTNSGKTTISKNIAKLLANEKWKVAVIQQDDYYLQQNMVRTVKSKDDENIVFYDYDCVQSIDEVGLCREIQNSKETFDYVIVEGNMLTELSKVYSLLDSVLFITLSREICYERRIRRTDYIPADLPGYFEQIVWPSYLEHLSNAKKMVQTDDKLSFLDGDRLDLTNSLTARQMLSALSRNLLRIQKEEIQLLEASNFVGSPKCGATSIFIGTTRDTFDDKKVVQLDYEAYHEMAYAELQKICDKIRENFSDIAKIAIIHRIGTVPVGEASVVIATSASHRSDAIKATELTIEELKRNVPIWKKEVYDDGTSSWKENTEYSKKNPKDSGDH